MFRMRGEVLGTLDASRGNIVLLAQDERGYVNLMHLVSQAWLDVEAGDTPHVTLAQLALASEGLIALSGGPRGPLDRLFLLEKRDAAEARLDVLAPLFPGRLLYRDPAAQNRTARPMSSPSCSTWPIAATRRWSATNGSYFAEASDTPPMTAPPCISDGTLIGQDASAAA